MTLTSLTGLRREGRKGWMSMSALCQAMIVLEDHSANGMKSKSPDGKSVGLGYGHYTKEAHGGNVFTIMALTSVFTVKEPREHLRMVLFIMEGPSKPKYSRKPQKLGK